MAANRQQPDFGRLYAQDGNPPPQSQPHPYQQPQQQESQVGGYAYPGYYQQQGMYQDPSFGQQQQQEQQHPQQQQQHFSNVMPPHSQPPQQPDDQAAFERDLENLASSTLGLDPATTNHGGAGSDDLPADHNLWAQFLDSQAGPTFDWDSTAQARPPSQGAPPNQPPPPVQPQSRSQQAASHPPPHQQHQQQHPENQNFDCQGSDMSFSHSNGGFDMFAPQQFSSAHTQAPQQPHQSHLQPQQQLRMIPQQQMPQDQHQGLPSRSESAPAREMQYMESSDPMQMQQSQLPHQQPQHSPQQFYAPQPQPAPPQQQYYPQETYNTNQAPMHPHQQQQQQQPPQPPQRVGSAASMPSTPNVSTAVNPAHMGLYSPSIAHQHSQSSHNTPQLTPKTTPKLTHTSSLPPNLNSAHAVDFSLQQQQQQQAATTAPLSAPVHIQPAPKPKLNRRSTAKREQTQFASPSNGSATSSPATQMNQQTQVMQNQQPQQNVVGNFQNDNFVQPPMPHMSPVLTEPPRKRVKSNVPAQSQFIQSVPPQQKQQQQYQQEQQQHTMSNSPRVNFNFGISTGTGSTPSSASSSPVIMPGMIPRRSSKVSMAKKSNGNANSPAIVLPNNLPPPPDSATQSAPISAVNTYNASRTVSTGPKIEPGTEKKDERKDVIFPTKLPELAGKSNDEILKAMLAESDYVDPPMTRSEYIASLGILPELVTSVPYNRLEYYAKSSIPNNKPPEEFARDGIAAAIASRLPPFALHPIEYNVLKDGVNHLHVTTYLNIRNAILQLWRMNHHVSVTRTEAAGCARDPRFFGLAEAAFEILVRHGYINFGVIDIPRCRNNFPYPLPIPEVRRPRLRILVLGAGVAGLGCARQLDGLFKQYDDFFTGYEDAPEIIVLEGRQRLGGRVYSSPLKKDPGDERIHKVDLGGQIVTGFGNGNPMSVIIRKQLGIACHELKDAGELFDEVPGGPVSASLDRRAERLFNDMLDRVSVYRAKPIPQHTVEGDVSLITAGKDPVGDGGRTIARMEANAVELPPLEHPLSDSSSLSNTPTASTMQSSATSAGGTSGEDHWAAGKPGYGKSVSGQTPLRNKLEDLGFVVNKGGNTDCQSTTEPLPKDNSPSLGATLDGQLELVRKLTDLTDQDLRLLNWHYANLEYANATAVHNLSLGSWDQDDGNEFSGKHTMVKDGGYMQVPRALYLYPSKLDVRFKNIVSEVAYDTTAGDQSRKKYTVTLTSGERISADRVVCTAPLGVLKAGSIAFKPELPVHKLKSIQNLGFGVLNKVVLVYDHCFWDTESDLIGVARDRNSGDPLDQNSYVASRGRFYMFWNCLKVVGKPCLVALMAGSASYETSLQSEEVILRDAHHVLSRMYPTTVIPHPTETIITHWHMDPMSLGSYSFVGPNATGKDYDNLAEPTCDDTLFFAGEATSRTHPATVHGAYLSGLRAAEEVFRSIAGGITLASPLVKPRPKPNLPLQTETVTFPPPPKSAYVGDTPPPVPKPVVLPQIPLEELLLAEQRAENSAGAAAASGMGPGRKRKPGAGRPRAKTSNIGGAMSAVPSGTPDANYKISGAAYNPSDAGSGPSSQYPPLHQLTRQEGMQHLARSRQLRDARIAKHNTECTRALSRAIGHEEPLKPEKMQLNPFIIFQKVQWENVRAEADNKRRAALGDPIAKATMADIRGLLSQRWRNLSEEEKKPIIEETNRNRLENERRMKEYKERLAAYELKAKNFKEEWLKNNVSEPDEEEKREMELAKSAGVI